MSPHALSAEGLERRAHGERVESRRYSGLIGLFAIGALAWLTLGLVLLLTSVYMARSGGEAATPAWLALTRVRFAVETAWTLGGAPMAIASLVVALRGPARVPDEGTRELVWLVALYYHALMLALLVWNLVTTPPLGVPLPAPLGMALIAGPLVAALVARRRARGRW